MAAATGFTGLIPTYALIGLLAPLLLLICRCGQGFSTGGEWGGAAAFLVEYAEPGKRGLTGSWQQFSTQIGATSGVLSAYLLAHYLAPDALQPPGAGGCRSLSASCSARSATTCAPAWRKRRPSSARRREARDLARAADGGAVHALQTDRPGVRAVDHRHCRNYVMIVYMPTYAVKTLHFAAGPRAAGAMLANLVVTVLTPFMGALSDRVGRRPMIGASARALFDTRLSALLSAARRRHVPDAVDRATDRGASSSRSTPARSR